MSFKYVNDLSILELVLFGSLLSEFDFRDQVASDVGIEEQYVAASSLSSQENISWISGWTKTNKMKLNEQLVLIGQRTQMRSVNLPMPG